MEVGITVDTFPGRMFKGKVRHVNTEAEFTPRNVQTTEKRAEQVFEMKVDVMNGAGLVQPGMYADVHIRDSTREGVGGGTQP
jgi:HlyD family secretion protein